MKTSSISEIKVELEHKGNKELLLLCLRLAKFKKENKELITFLLFEENDIISFTENVKIEIDDYFKEINSSNIYYIKKSVRKILRNVNKYIKFAASKQVEAEILIHFCNNFINFSIPVQKSQQLRKMYEGQLQKTDVVLASLHPDLQYDLRKQLMTGTGK